MQILCCCLLAAPLGIGLAVAASAQDRQPKSVQTQMIAPIQAPVPLTGKEQRVDNCKVPIDKRGSKTRAANCTLASPGF
jgi:hypothetical protein